MAMAARLDARELVEQAEAFAKTNSDIYDHLLRWAKTRVTAQLPLTAERMGLEVEDLAILKHGDGRGKSFPHALRAPLMRMLMRDAPEIRPSVRLSRSKVDYAFGFIDWDRNCGHKGEV
jgi:hypothetical protein